VPLTPGTSLGPYEILAPLGQGGMGEVYRAKDTRLGREVAIKVLPEHLSAQPEIRSRFEREAKTISSLNHPNICVLFDVGRAPGEAGSADIDYLVMELVEGETLAERLTRGPLPNADVMRFGVQIADALDRAHRAGVIHRDLKPGNVMITRSGAKLLDFGLARVTGLAPAPGSGSIPGALSQSPTVAQALTAEGSLLGTFQYMSPEQLEGREADARSDIWALGCVLYEMVTGRRAFDGRSQASLIAAILEREPAPVGEAPSGSAITAAGGPPHGIERLIRNCLAKDPDERIQTAHDAKLHLQGIAEGAGLAATSTVSAPGMGVAPTRAPGRGGSKLAWAFAAAGLIAAIGTFAWLYPRIGGPAPSIRVRMMPEPGSLDQSWPRMSPDGTYLASIRVDTLGVLRAFVRPMDQLNAHPVPGTEGVSRVYWSPDARELAFVADDKIKRVSIAGGSPVVVCAAPGGADLSWGSRGQILMDGRATDSIRVVAAGGGDLLPASRIDRDAGEAGAAWPCFLPDGEHFLFIGVNPRSLSGSIRLGKLGSLESKRIGESDGRVEYAPGGWVLYLRGSTLLAQKLDLGAGKLTGQPITIHDNVDVGASQGHFSVSQTGILAFSPASAGSQRSIHTADRSGALGPALVSGPVSSPQLSPEGRRLLFTRAPLIGTDGGEIFVLDLDRGTDTRLTFTSDSAMNAVWSEDGRRFAYLVKGARGQVVYTGSPDGVGGQDSTSIPAPGDAFLSQWLSNPDRFLLFGFQRPTFMVSPGSESQPSRTIGDSTRTLRLPRISPDGRWLVGTSGRLPNVHIYVQSLEGPTRQWQISTTPAFHARWTRSGQELVFETIDGRLMAVDIDTRQGFQAGMPRELFRLPMATASPTQLSWTCDSNGERFFLVSEPQRGRDVGAIELVTGFENLVNRK
jgi:Tol biopolymer transport system component